MKIKSKKSFHTFIEDVIFLGVCVSGWVGGGGDIDTLFQSAGEEIFLTLDRLKIFQCNFCKRSKYFSSHVLEKKSHSLMTPLLTSAIFLD